MMRRRPPLRRCLDCGGDCYGWSESSRCPACTRRRRDLGPLGLEPDGAAAEARRRRLERFAWTPEADTSEDAAATGETGR